MLHFVKLGPKRKVKDHLPLTPEKVQKPKLNFLLQRSCHLIFLEDLVKISQAGLEIKNINK